MTTLCLQLDGSYKTPILFFYSENSSDFLNRPPNTNLYNVHCDSEGVLLARDQPRPTNHTTQSSGGNKQQLLTEIHTQLQIQTRGGYFHI